MYNEKHLVSIHQTNDIVTGLRFGRFGREDNTLIMTHASGGLSIKILPRRANLEMNTNGAGPPPEQVRNATDCARRAQATWSVHGIIGWEMMQQCI